MKSYLKMLSLAMLGSFVFAEDEVSHLNTTHISSHEHKLPGLNAKQFAEAKSTDLANTLDDTPGFAIGGMGGETNRPIFRSLDRTHVQIAEDGNLSLDLSDMSADHAVGSTGAFAKSLKIHKGSFLLPYTSTIQGARIDLDRGFFLSDPYHDGEMYSTYHQLGTAYSYPQNGANADVGSEIAMGNFTPRFQISGRYQDALWVPDSLVPNSSSGRAQVGGSIQYDQGHDRLGAAYEYQTRNYYLPAGVHGSGALVEFEKFNTQLGYVYKAKNVHSHLTFLQSSIYQLETESGRTGKGDLFGAEFARNVYHIRNQWEIHTHPFDFNTGAEFMMLKNDYAGPSTPKNQRNIYSSWFHIEREGEHHKLRWGIRGEHFQDELILDASDLQEGRGSVKPAQETVYASRLELSHFVMNYLHYEIGLHKSARIPLVEEYYSDGPHLAANSFDIGNDEIEPEESYGLDFNLDGRDNFFSWRLKGYGNYYTNYLQLLPNGELNFAKELPEYEVTGTEALTTGYEINMEMQFNSHWRYEFINEYIYGQNLTIDAPLIRMPPLTVQQKLKYLSHSYGDYTLSSNYYFPQNRTAEFELSTPAGHSIDLGWMETFTGTFGIIRAKFGVNNLLHERVHNALSRTKFLLPQPGRHIETRLDWSF